MHFFINIVLFECAWFAAILVDWKLSAICCLFLFMHGMHFERGKHQYASIGVIISIGILTDGLLIYSGLINIIEERPNILGLPLWLISLWVAFGLTLYSALSWWQTNPKLFVLLMAVFAPLSYQGGVSLSALQIPTTGFIVLILFWTILALGILKYMPKTNISEDTPCKT